MENLPAEVRVCLWSYDTSRLDLEQDKKRIITNVLTRGTAPATAWLSRTYAYNDIREAVEDPMPGEWDAKSLNLWSLLYGVPFSLDSRALKTSHARF